MASILGQTGLAFIGLLIGGLASIPPFVWYCRSIQAKQFNEKARFSNPNCDFPRLGGCYLFAGVSLLVRVECSSDIHWVLCISGTAFYAIGHYLLL